MGNQYFIIVLALAFFAMYEKMRILTLTGEERKQWKAK
jgi:hypothetical protein